MVPGIPLESSCSSECRPIVAAMVRPNPAPKHKRFFWKKIKFLLILGVGRLLTYEGRKLFDAHRAKLRQPPVKQGLVSTGFNNLAAQRIYRKWFLDPMKTYTGGAPNVFGGEVWLLGELRSYEDMEKESLKCPPKTEFQILVSKL